VKAENCFASHVGIKQGLKISLTQQKELALKMIQNLKERATAITKLKEDANLDRSIIAVIEMLSLDLIALRNFLQKLD